VKGDVVRKNGLKEVALGEPSYCQNYGDNVMTTFDHFLHINVIISYKYVTFPYQNVTSYNAVISQL